MPARKKLPRKPLVKLAKPTPSTEKNASSGTGVKPAPASVRVEAKVSAVPAVMAKQSGWYQALFGRMLGKNSKQGKVDQATLDELKSSILTELKAFKGGSTGISGSPFSNMLLPGVAAPKRKLPWLKYALVGLVVALGVALVVGNKTPPGPLGALNALEKSLHKGDTALFNKHIDVDGLSVRLVDHVFTEKELAGGAGGVKNRLEAYLKPGLADNLREEMLAVVASKGFPAEPVAGGVLYKLWQDAGAEKLRFSKPKMVMGDARIAIAEVQLLRPEWGLAVPVRVALENQNGVWRLTDVADIKPAMNQLHAAVLAAETAVQTPTQSELAGLVEVKSVRKIAARNKALLVGVVLYSKAPVSASNIKLNIVFADAAGTPLKQAEVLEVGPLPAGGRLERTLSLPLDRSKNTERYVAELPLEALQVKAVVQSLQLPSGKVVGF
jgi:hypothetical protein